MMFSKRVALSAVAIALVVLLSASCGEGCGVEPPPPPPPPPGSGLQVINPAVRACDALFRLEGDEVPSVVFSASVTGESIPKAPRLAIAFAANGDAAIPAENLADFSFKGAATVPVLVESKCYDASGAAVGDGALVFAP